MCTIDIYCITCYVKQKLNCYLYSNSHTCLYVGLLWLALAHISFQEGNSCLLQYCHTLETVFVLYMLCTKFNIVVQMMCGYMSHLAFSDPKWTILLQNSCPEAVHKRQ
jgi:hypothetical protein